MILLGCSIDFDIMKLRPAERLKLRDLLLGTYGDWAGVRSGLDAKSLKLSQSSLDRFFSGERDSDRTFRTVALLLGTTAEALRNQLRILSGEHGARKISHVGSARPLKDPEAFRVAFQLWVEMTTRKLGLPIDPNQDIITEVYDSWYAFFRTARELIKAIPLHRDPKSPELRHLIHLSQAVLNDGLRPHLQRWQARFRRWADASTERAPTVTPQEAQQRFPDWNLLRDDLLATNQRLMSYVVALESMVGQPNQATPRNAYAPNPRSAV